eukprot:CAMPEP_0184701452 /NCGR_PEP_ID=MMETSP0313-20130426/19968_1 /TAXON_ID=2792 /ORGANISM="Porphyridium aerugineum, Strain SAG 1380-2" /LENGTH=555 /DNA_ID=CAMNT_0027161523 /DNA_START=65 /DNA_END=1732 /DNA_ORIENTATION=-
MADKKSGESHGWDDLDVDFDSSGASKPKPHNAAQGEENNEELQKMMGKLDEIFEGASDSATATATSSVAGEAGKPAAAAPGVSTPAPPGIPTTSTTAPNTRQQQPSRSALPSNVRPEDVEALKVLFSDISDRRLAAVLEAHNGSVDRAAEFILSNPDDFSNHLQATSPPPRQVPNPNVSSQRTNQGQPIPVASADDFFGSSGADAGSGYIAPQIDDPNIDPETREALRQVAQMEADERMAEDLQRALVIESYAKQKRLEEQQARMQEARGPFASFMDTFSTPSQQQGSQQHQQQPVARSRPSQELPVGPPLMQVMAGDAGRVEAEADRAKTIFSRVLHDQLMLGVPFNDIVGEQKVVGAVVKYGLERIQIASFSIADGRGFQVAIKPDRILVFVPAINITLNVGRWSYERTALPHFMDTGTAQAVLNSVYIGLTLAPIVPTRPDTSRSAETSEPDTIPINQNQTFAWKVVQTHVAVNGDVNLKFMESKASWLYNALSTFFIDRIGSATSQALNDALLGPVKAKVQDATGGGENREAGSAPAAPPGEGTLEDPIDI